MAAPSGKKVAPKKGQRAAMSSGSPRDEQRMALRRYLDQRLVGMRTERYSWWAHWAQLAEYILPRRYKWLITQNQANRGSQINQNIIDSTATIAARTLAAGMMAGITSPAKRWFRPVIPNDDAMEIPEVKLWLDEVGKRMLHVMSESNFYNALHVLYMDLCIFGTAVMIIQEDYEDVFRCYNPAAGEYYLASSARFQNDTQYREFTLTVRQLVQKFGIDNVSDTARTLYKSQGAGLDKEIIVGHAIEPDTEGDNFGKQTNMPYREIYWEIGSGENYVLSITGYHEQCFIAPRWDTVSNDPYGRSPAMDALGDVKQLQQETKRKAQAIDKMVNPPMYADVSLKNQPATLIPGGITYGPTTQGNVGFKPVYEIEPPIGELKEDIKEVQERIKKIFFNDLFLMISSIDTVHTATDIDARKEEKLIQLGPVLERFENEALTPAITRIFNIMLRLNLFPKPPRQIQGMPIQIQYSSVMADAQRAVETTGIERLFAFAGNLAAAIPQIMDTLDPDEAIDEYGAALGVSPKIIRTPEAVANIRQMRNQQQEENAQMQQGLAMAEGAKTLSQVDVGGGQNAIQAMVGTQGGAQ